MFPRSYGSSAQRVWTPPATTAFAPQFSSMQGARVQRPTPCADAETPLKPEGINAARLPLTRKVLLCAGLTVLCLLISLPVSDAVSLMADFNYTFWSGQGLPMTVILALCTVLLVYFAVAGSLPIAQDTENYSMHNLATMISTFCTLLGAILVLTSLFLYYREEYVINSLTYNCKGSTATRDVRRYYLGLLSLRTSPTCSQKWSVEECEGFADAAPVAYSTYFRNLEMKFHCSGFCEMQGNSSMPSLSQLPSGQATSSFLSKESSEFHQLDSNKLTQKIHRASALPPALFSRGAYKTSCDGAAARNLSFLAIGISKVWWWMSIVLIGLSALVGLGEWVCLQRRK